METGIHELTAGYALDALDPAEREAFEAHLAGLRALPGGARLVLGGDRRRLPSPPTARRRARRSASGSSTPPGPRSRTSYRIELAAAHVARARGSDGDRRRGRDRPRDLRRVAERPARRLEGRPERAGDCRGSPRRCERDDGQHERGSGKVVVDEAGPRCSCSTPFRPRPRADLPGLGDHGQHACLGRVFAPTGDRAVVPIPQTVPAGAVVAVTVEPDGGVSAPTQPPAMSSDPV